VNTIYAKAEGSSPSTGNISLRIFRFRPTLLGADTLDPDVVIDVTGGGRFPSRWSAIVGQATSILSFGWQPQNASRSAAEPAIVLAPAESALSTLTSADRLGPT
jgi:hypothetical protein